MAPRSDNEALSSACIEELKISGFLQMISPFGWVCRPTRTGYIYLEKYMATGPNERASARRSFACATASSAATGS